MNFLFLLLATPTNEQDATTGNVIANFLLDKLPSYLLSLVLLGVSYVIARIVTGMIKRKFDDEKLQDTPPDVIALIKRMTFIGVFIVCALISLGITGLLGNLGWLFGSLGLAIGLSLQGIASHFIAGILIILQKKTGVGNYIRLANIEGTILEVGTRATTIQTLDGIEVLIPNKNFIDNEVIIYTSNPYRRLTIEIGIDYSTDIGTVSNLLTSHLHGHKDVVQDAPKEVLVASFGDSSVDLTVRFWVPSRSEWWTIQSNLTKEIKELFDTNGIEMPFPQRVVHLVQDKVLQPHLMTPHL